MNTLYNFIISNIEKLSDNDLNYLLTENEINSYSISVQRKFNTSSINHIKSLIKEIIFNN